MKKLLLSLCLVANLSLFASADVVYDTERKLGILKDDFSKSEKIYIDEKELDISEDAFHVHVGSNLWIETDTLHRDMSGLYTFESRIVRTSAKAWGYEKKWKCPYCYSYWPIGTPCQNPSCPSKYK